MSVLHKEKRTGHRLRWSWFLHPQVLSRVTKEENRRAKKVSHSPHTEILFSSLSSLNSGTSQTALDPQFCPAQAEGPALVLLLGHFLPLVGLFTRNTCLNLRTIHKFCPGGVPQLIEGQTVNHRVASSIPSQGTCLYCWPGPQ